MGIYTILPKNMVFYNIPVYYPKFRRLFSAKITDGLQAQK